MSVSKERYYRNFLIAMLVVGVLIFTSAPVANKYLFRIDLINTICKCALISEGIVIVLVITIILIKNRGLKNYINNRILLSKLEKNLISVGAYTKLENKVFVELPKIKLEKGIIKISLNNLKIRTIIERYLDSFSTALPERYIVTDYYISQNNAEVIIVYEDMKNYMTEKYTLADYATKVKSIDTMSFYFDKKHIVSLRDYPHFLISGSSGSGKSYLANELVIQAIVKKYEIVICDLKRSYGLYIAYTDYVYEINDIILKLQSVESEMSERMKLLQPELDKNPNVIAADIGFKPKLVVIEEYISLISALDKKQKEEVESIVKNLSVLARQSSIHIMIIMQAAGTENINATTRSNLTKILLGNAQSNIMTATFGTGVDIPNVHSKRNKGEGLIQLDRITMLRVPEIVDIDYFKEEIG